MKRPRIVRANDHTLLLDALKKLIEPEFEVVGAFGRLVRAELQTKKEQGSFDPAPEGGTATTPEGRSMKQVAMLLNVSPRTVAFHKYTMMDHLQIKSSAELIEYAMRSALRAC